MKSSKRDNSGKTKGGRILLGCFPLSAKRGKIPFCDFQSVNSGNSVTVCYALPAIHSYWATKQRRKGLQRSRLSQVSVVHVV